MANVDEQFEEMMVRVKKEWEKKTQREKELTVSSFDKFCNFVKRAAGALWNAISDVLDAIGNGIEWLWEKVTGWL